MNEPTVHQRLARIVPSREPDDILEWCDPDEVRGAIYERDDRITELEAEVARLRDALEMYESGYKGSCMCCEPVALKNVELLAKYPQEAPHE